MPFEIKVIADPGSATLCGGCPRIHENFDSRECGAFGSTLQPIYAEYFAISGYKRLPECVKAERRAQEGA